MAELGLAGARIEDLGVLPRVPVGSLVGTLGDGSGVLISCDPVFVREPDQPITRPVRAVRYEPQDVNALRWPDGRGLIFSNPVASSERGTPGAVLGQIRVWAADAARQPLAGLPAADVKLPFEHPAGTVTSTIPGNDTTVLVFGSGGPRITEPYTTRYAPDLRGVWHDVWTAEPPITQWWLPPGPAAPAIGPFHTFDSSREAYDASQCDPVIRDGDVLRVPAEGITAVLYQAWPIAINEPHDVQHGAFHGHPGGPDGLAATDNGRYAQSVRLARELLAPAQLTQRDLAAAPAGTVLHWTSRPGRPSVPVTVLPPDDPEGNVLLPGGSKLAAQPYELTRVPRAGLEIHAHAECRATRVRTDPEPGQ
jgi:hypothetical protein